MPPWNDRFPAACRVVRAGAHTIDQGLELHVLPARLGELLRQSLYFVKQSRRSHLLRARS
jgi:hypothetical protein